MLFGLGKYKELVKNYEKLANRYEEIERNYDMQQVYIDNCITQLREYEDNLILLGNHCSELEKELKRVRSSNSALKRYNAKYKQQLSV